MAFFCPECASKSLDITAGLELPPDSRSDEITLQTVKCDQCGFAGVAVYEESRRGSLDRESVSHIGYRLPAKDRQSVERAIKRCPHPRNARCRCAAHRRFGQRNDLGRWNGLERLHCGEPFAMRLS